MNLSSVTAGVIPSSRISLVENQGAIKAKASSFSGVLKDVNAQQLAERLLNPQAFEELVSLQRKFFQSVSISPKELILYQVKAAQFGLNVELISKIAESVSATIRKFQQNP